jgi:alpha-L-fucosidase
MSKIGKMARENQPGILIVDRTVHGEFENYRTPEQQIPESVPDYPWESCITLGDSWYSTGPGENYKSSTWAIHTLIKIVAKGGNFLLGIGPDKTGELVPEVYKRLAEIGEWMEVNSEAIYNTKPLYPYQLGKFCFTQSKDGKTRYALYLVDEGEVLPKYLEIPVEFLGLNKSVNILGYSKNITITSKQKIKSIEVPKNFILNSATTKALVIKIIQK